MRVTKGTISVYVAMYVGTRGVFLGVVSAGLRVYKMGGSRPGLWSLCCTMLLVLSASPRAHGDAVFGEVFPYRQPDGTLIEVRVWGDEFYRVVESLDGYTLVGDPTTGAACYARLSPDGRELISTGVAVGSALRAGLNLPRHIRISRASARAKIAAARARFVAGEAGVVAALPAPPQLAPPNIGNVQGIVLLVDFEEDEPWSIPASNINNYCNQVGYTGYGNNGSVRDYFYDVSDGNLTYTNFVPTAYYRAQHPRSYYEDREIPFGVRARELMIEALTDLDNQGFDFSQYDSNGDGLVDGVNCFYAGTRKPLWAEGLWPHSWSVSFAADGVSTYRYQMTDIGDSLRLGTFCHENGHMICYWPDLYDYGYESAGVGDFCLMGYGASDTNPAEPSAYMKYIAGWSTTTILSTPQAGLSVPSGVNTLYKYEHPTLPNEYYMIENRQRTGRDAAIPDAGLAIWHIDTLGSNDNEQMTPDMHYLVTLVQADGNWDLENNRNYGDTTDLWAFPEYAQCTSYTTPNTAWWDGSVSGLFVTGISISSSAMTFTFSGDTDCNDNGISDYQDIDEGDSQDCNENGIPDECEIDENSSAPGGPFFCTSDCNPDLNENGIPDDCECWPSSPPQAEMIIDAAKSQVPNEKNRYLSFAVGDAGLEQSIMVKFNNLPDPYDVFDGNCMWVGAPFQVTESPARTDPGQPGFADFWAAKLQCDKPAPTDFTTRTGDCLNNVCYHSENAGATCTDDSDCVRAILHVFGDYVVPSSRTEVAEYDVRVLDSDCPQDQINNPAVAGSLIMNTSLWGDVTASYAVNGVWPAPNGIVNVADAVAIQSKIGLAVTVSLGKPRGDVVGEYPPEVTLSPDLIVDIVDQKRVSSAGALQSFPYQSPLGPWPCPEACHGK